MGNASPPSCQTWIGLGSLSSSASPCPTGKGTSTSNLVGGEGGVNQFPAHGHHLLKQSHQNQTWQAWPVIQKVVVRWPGGTSQCALHPSNQKISSSCLHHRMHPSRMNPTKTSSKLWPLGEVKVSRHWNLNQLLTTGQYCRPHLLEPLRPSGPLAIFFFSGNHPQAAQSTFPWELGRRHLQGNVIDVKD